MSASAFHPSSGRPDCVAGHIRFELRNVAANYPFERSRRFPGIRPNSRHGDYSRVSCEVGDAQLGLGPRSQQGRLCGPWSRGASLRWQALPRFSARSRDDPAATKPATPLLTLRWTFPAKRASVVVTDSKPDGFAPLPPPAPCGPPRGLGGGGAMLCRHDREECLHVQAQTRANRQGAVFI
jgi:hypothetical protein